MENIVKHDEKEATPTNKQTNKEPFDVQTEGASTMHKKMIYPPAFHL